MPFSVCCILCYSVNFLVHKILITYDFRILRYTHCQYVIVTVGVDKCDIMGSGRVQKDQNIALMHSKHPAK